MNKLRSLRREYVEAVGRILRAAKRFRATQAAAEAFLSFQRFRWLTSSIRFDDFCVAVEHTRWYRLVGDEIDFDDWKLIDAMYRSRALDYPGIGHCMVPCIDMANHASHQNTVAVYEVDKDGDAVLLLRDGKTLEKGNEVTISYGDEKGACEMLYSYGFLEKEMDSAKSVFVALTIPEDDLQRSGKEAIAGCAPGAKLIDVGVATIDFDGDYIWLLCINQEDGLRFDIAQTVDGQQEMHALFNEHEITDGAAQIKNLLQKSDLHEVYQLRAFVRLQERVQEQMSALTDEQEDIQEKAHGPGTSISTFKFETIMKLRHFEFELLEQAYEYFAVEVCIYHAYDTLSSTINSVDLLEMPSTDWLHLIDRLPERLTMNA